jgi:hypothetical protein
MPNGNACKSWIGVAAILLTAALSLWGSVQFCRKQSALLRESPDPFHVAEQEVRLANVRAAISPDATLGYLTDHPEGIMGEARFFVAQYYLAPRVVQNSLAQNLILGDFSGPINLSAFVRDHALRVERDFGDGVVLFRKEQARH